MSKYIETDKLLGILAEEYVTCSEAEEEIIIRIMRKVKENITSIDFENSISEALQLLDAVRAKGTMEYNDYSHLHAAISAIMPED